LRSENRGLKGLASRILWPRDLMDYTNVRFRNVVGREVELPLVKLHYHYAVWEVAWRKNMNYALQAALQQLRAPGEIPQIVEWASRRFDEEGLQLAAVDPAWAPL
jgi:hypothetical protein